jgi:lysophospholipase L1-like esterase
MKDDGMRAAGRAAKHPLSSLPRKLVYGVALSLIYIFLIYISNDYTSFLYFFLICLGISFLPIFGLLSGLLRSFVLLAGALLVMSLLPAALLQGDYRTLPANMDLVIDISSENIPGIEGPQHITTDAEGYRTGDQVIRYDDETPYRIFAIGASTTEQAYLDDARTWTRLLEANLNALLSHPVEVINTGVAGLRMVHHLATQEHVEDLNPDLLLWLVGINDWNRQVTRYFDADPRFVAPLSARLKQRFRRSVAFTFYQIYVALPQRSTLTVRHAHFTAMTDRASRPDVVRYLPTAVSEDFAATMAQLAARCHQGAYRCMLMTQPNAYALDAPASQRQYFRLTPPRRSYTLDIESLVHIARLYNGFVRDFAAKEQLPLCDLEAIVPKGTEAFYDDAHFNTNGARIVAEAMTACIVDQLPEP